MYEYRVSFLSLSLNLIFDFKSRVRENTQEFVVDMMKIYEYVNGDNQLTINPLQINNAKVKIEITTLVDKYRSKVPEINGFNTFFKSLAENEKYLFLPGEKFNSLDRFKLRNFLKANIEGKSIKQIEKENVDLFGQSIKKYAISGFGDQNRKIGQPIKQKRKCRFCQKSMPKVTFSQKAHAISEALGNKTVVLFDECDNCNEKFSKSIEPHIVEYLSLFRTMFGVKGKRGDTKYKGQNFSISKNKDVKIELKDVKRPPENVFPYVIPLKSDKKVVLLDIYKCLCKYFLSVIEDKELLNFKETIRWVNGEVESKTLPFISESITYNRASLQPRMTVYIRKRKSKNFPFAVCEFQLTVKRFVFIIPFSNQDEKDFTNKVDYKRFWNAFKHYKNAGTWLQTDFSSKTPKIFEINLSATLDKDKRNAII